MLGIEPRSLGRRVLLLAEPSPQPCLYFIFYFIYFSSIYLFKCGGGSYATVSVCHLQRLKDSWYGSQFSSVLEIELRFSSLGASVFTCWTILPALFKKVCCVSVSLSHGVCEEVRELCRALFFLFFSLLSPLHDSHELNSACQPCHLAHWTICQLFFMESAYIAQTVCEHAIQPR